MTTMIGTLEFGFIPTGFYAGDTSRIQLGDLDPMVTTQFAEYAVGTITTELIPVTAPDVLDEWRKQSAFIIERTTGLRDRVNSAETSLMNLSELFEAARDDESAVALSELCRQTAPLELAVHYPENPFRATGGGVSVAIVDHEGQHHYTVSSPEFFGLTRNVLSGGIFGWNKSIGIFPEVRTAADALAKSLSH